VRIILPAFAQNLDGADSAIESGEQAQARRLARAGRSKQRGDSLPERSSWAPS
jgi:hypothetical protein